MTPDNKAAAKTAIQIDAGRHWMVTGATGAGKTFWAQNWFLPRFKRQIVVDTEELEFEEEIWDPVSSKKAVALASRNRPFRVKVPFDVGDAGREEYATFADGLLRTGHDVVIWVDEYPDFTKNSQQTQEGLRLTRKARKRGVTMAFATQRPQSIDKDAYTQCFHHVFFGMDEGDIDYWHTRAPYIRELAPKVSVDNHKWIYHRSGHPAQVFSAVPEYSWEAEKRKR